MNIKHLNNFQLIWSLIPNNFKVYAKIIILMSLVAMIFETLSLGMVIPLMFSLAGPESNGSESSLHQLMSMTNLSEIDIKTAAFWLLLLFLVKNLFTIIFTKLQAKFVFSLEKHLSKKLLQIYINQPFSFYFKNKSSDLIRNAVAEVSLFSHNAVASVFSLLTELLILIGILSLLIYVNPLITSSCIIFFTLIGSIYHLTVSGYLSSWSKDRQISESKRIQVIQEIFGLIKEIKIYAKENYFLNHYSKFARLSSKSGENQQSLQVVPKALLEFSVILIICLFLLTNKHDSSTMIATLGLYGAAAFRLIPSVNRINSYLQALKFSEVTIKLLHKEFSLFRDDEEASYGNIKFNESINVTNLTYRYPDNSKFIFNDISLKIDKGDIACITGSSGAGKSTLIDLICGLLRPISGQITIDDILVNNYVRSWQNQITYVPQNIFLIDGSIKDNIVFGDCADNINNDRLLESIEYSGLNELLRSKPMGMDTIVGESGILLSGGQKQRIGLARALYKRSSLLILDEATNALDPLLERAVIQSIAKIKGLTIIWISHSDKPINFANKLIHINSGNVKCTSIKRLS